MLCDRSPGYVFCSTAVVIIQYGSCFGVQITPPLTVRSSFGLGPVPFFFLSTSFLFGTLKFSRLMFCSSCSRPGIGHLPQEPCFVLKSPRSSPLPVAQGMLATALYLQLAACLLFAWAVRSSARDCARLVQRARKCQHSPLDA